MSVFIRPAAPADTREMCDLINPIIAEGGTTALTEPVSAQDIAEWMASDSTVSAWHLAEDPSGVLLGFQWIGPHRDLPPEACDIATFVRVGQTQLGIGSKLFDATMRAARQLGYDWISAEIRADNAGGIAYYRSRGFRPWRRNTGIELEDGQIVDKVLKRFDLD